MFCVVSHYVKSSLTVVRELELKSSFVLRVSSCYFGICCCHYSVKNSYKRKKDKTDFCDLLFLLFCIFVYL